MCYSSVPRDRPAGVLASSLTPRWQRALAGPRWSIGGQRCAGQLSAAQSRCAPPFACDRPAIDPLAHSLAPGRRPLAHLSPQQRPPYTRRLLRPSLPPLGLSSRACYPPATPEARAEHAATSHRSFGPGSPPLCCLLCRARHIGLLCLPAGADEDNSQIRANTAARNQRPMSSPLYARCSAIAARSALCQRRRGYGVAVHPGRRWIGSEVVRSRY